MKSPAVVLALIAAISGSGRAEELCGTCEEDTSLLQAGRAQQRQAGGDSSSEAKPVQPQRNYNPVCIGIIGGVGPEASADVLTKMVSFAGKQPWHYQARDTPNIYLASAARLDGTTQNAWNHLTEPEQIATIGQLLDDIVAEFPPCVREQGAFGLACNTIHQYLFSKTNAAKNFMSLMNAVNMSFAAGGAVPGSKLYILGSAVTMSDEGEYGELFRYYGNVNGGISDKDYLWQNVILKVQSGNLDEAGKNLYKFLADNKVPKDAPISLSCTELPVAAATDPKLWASYPNMIDPNDALAQQLLLRAMSNTEKNAPELYQGWKMGVDNFVKHCCVDANDKGCDLCCKDHECAAAKDSAL